MSIPDAAIEAAIEQALAVGDDGAALVGEVEEYLRRRVR